MTAEELLWVHYQNHRDRWTRAFVTALKDARITSYLAQPDEMLLPPVAASMDFLIDAIHASHPETYVKQQRRNFEQRVAAGIAMADLDRGAKVAEVVMRNLIDEALASAGEVRDLMQKRMQRYWSLTSLTLIEMLMSRTEPPPNPR
jgi:hypothetical protein